MTSRSEGILSPSLLPASVAIFTMVALVAFEGLAVSAAIPQVAGELGNVDLIPWVITGFLMASGVATVLAGPLVDALGVRIMFRWSVAVFAAAGTAAAAAPTMEFLVVLRVLQGVGGGLVVAVGLAAVGLVFPPRLVSRAYAANSTVWGAMGVAGPALAAFLLTALDWRWIFGVNLPLGLLALAAGWGTLPGPAGDPEPLRADGRGAALVIVFTVSALLAVDELGVASLAWGAVALAAVGAYRFHADRHPRPVVRLEHIARMPFAGLGLGIGLLLAGAFAAEAYLPLFVRGGRGASTALTAWSVLFFTVGWTTGSNVAGRIVDRRSESGLILAGFVLTVPALAVVAAAAALSAPLWVVFAAAFVAGTGVGASTNSALTLLRSVAPTERLGRATAAHQFMRNQGITFGAAIGGAVILLVLAGDGGSMEGVRQILDGSVTADAAAAGGIERGFATAATVGAVIAASGVVPVAVLRRRLAPARRAAGRPSDG